MKIVGTRTEIEKLKNVLPEEYLEYFFGKNNVQYECASEDTTISLVTERDRIIFGEGFNESKYRGGVRRFEKLGLKELEKLFEGGFIDPNGTQNYSPTAEEFYEFIKRHPLFTAHGYTVSPERTDCRTTIEGIEYDGAVTMEMVIDFTDLCNGADEFTVGLDHLYCWYD